MDFSTDPPSLTMMDFYPGQEIMFVNPMKGWGIEEGDIGVIRSIHRDNFVVAEIHGMIGKIESRDITIPESPDWRLAILHETIHINHEELANLI